MGIGHAGDVCVLGFAFDGVLLEVIFDGAELVAYVFKLLVELVAVVGEPVLDAFE